MIHITTSNDKMENIPYNAKNIQVRWKAIKNINDYDKQKQHDKNFQYNKYTLSRDGFILSENLRDI